MNKNAQKTKNCPICKEDYITGSNSQKFCGKGCRESTYKEYRMAHQLQQYDKASAIPSTSKIQCKFCFRYYRQLGSHVYQRHEMTAREYKEYWDMEVKKGMLSPELRKIKAEHVVVNGTIKNLKKGKINWFKKGQVGVGVYHRSHITLDRIRNLWRYKK